MRMSYLNYKNMNIKLLLLFLGTLWIKSGYTQNAEAFIPGELAIQFHSEKAFQDFLAQEQQDIRFVSRVSDHLNLHFFKYDNSTVNIDQLVKRLNANPLISAAGQNFYVQKRATIPSDEFFNNQQSFDIIQAPEAWDINTSAPEDMVVAVIEGADISHEDIAENIWTNAGEIPNDGIDNDNNGYPDDYWGVNVEDSTDVPIVDDHGIAVAGIIGARGDNQIGVAGMLWDLKMMIVSSNLSYLKIIESYEYVYNMRKRYNETNGAEGAYVVATNASFGQDNRFIDENPLFAVWCDAYDLLGSVGILSIAAVNNSKVNIGEVGDIPGLCPSEYLITVTETDLEDKLKAAYNPIHVDLAAPGRSFTTDLNDSYSLFTGTSAATPIVTGAIAMMYSYPCQDFQMAARSESSQTALQLKRILLENVDQLDELAGMVESGGRLNVFNAMQSLQSFYGSPKGNLGFIKVYPNPILSNGLLSVEYQTPETTDYDLKIYDSMGRLVYHHIIPGICSPKVIEVPLDRFQIGSYFMSIENINNIKSTKFFVR